MFSEPKDLRKQPGFAHPTAATQVVEVMIDLFNRLVETGISEVGYHICFNMAPQMIHGIELGAGNGEPSQGNAKVVGQTDRLISAMRRSSV
jgi:hypothetical protein